jgi:hypothetical protein
MAFQICGSFAWDRLDALRIVAAFQIENAAVAPAGFVIVDQSSRRVG